MWGPYGNERDMKTVHKTVNMVERQETEDNEVLLLDDLCIIAHDLHKVGGDVSMREHHAFAPAYVIM